MLSRREILRALSVTAGAFAMPGMGGCGAQLSRSVNTTKRPTEDLHAQLAEIVDRLARAHHRVSALATVREGRTAMADTAGGELRGISDAGVVLAIGDGPRMRELATFDTSGDGLRALAGQLESGETSKHGEASHRRGVRSFALPPDESLPDEPKTWLDAAAALAVRAERAGKSRITYWRAQIGAMDTETFYVDPQRQLTQRIVRATAEVSLVAWTGRWAASQRTAHGTTAGLKATAISEDNINSAADRVLGLVYARPAPPGERAVVLAPEVAAAFIHGGVAPALTADFLASQLGVVPRVGQKFGSDQVTIHDDPTLAGGFGSYAYDDCGRMASKTRLIDGGVLAGLLATEATAHKLGIEPTASSRRASPTAPLVASPSNLSWEAGTTSPEDLIAGVDDGLLVEGPAGAWLDPVTGRVTIRAALALRITGGHPSGHVYRDITLCGQLEDVLGQVSGRSTAPDPAAAWLAGNDTTPHCAAMAPHILTRMEVM